MERKTDIIIILILILVVFLLYVNYRDIRADGGECIKQPLIYGAEVLKSRNKAAVMCNCMLDKPNTPILFFNSSSTWYMGTN